MLETNLVLPSVGLQIVNEQLLVLWQQGEHHRQPIEYQQETFTQRGLVWNHTQDIGHTTRHLEKQHCISGGQEIC